MYAKMIENKYDIIVCSLNNLICVRIELNK